MAKKTEISKPDKHVSPFERIKRTNETGTEYWSSREFACVLGYNDYRNFEAVVEKAKLACFNSGQRIEDHFVDVTDMIEIGKGGQRPVKTVLLSRYACYLTIQNADPRKEIVAHGQTGCIPISCLRERKNNHRSRFVRNFPAYNFAGIMREHIENQLPARLYRT